MKKAYPNLLQSWGIVGIAVLATVIFIPVNTQLTDFLGQEIAMLIYYSLSMGATFFLAYALRSKSNNAKPIPTNLPKLNWAFLVIIGMLGIQVGLTMPLANLIPMPEVVKEMFAQLGEMKGWAAFTTIAIAAPILEELIFRGIILDGLLKNYKPIKAILWSSILFGIVHLNPWQFISAMLIGCFSGWLYYRTHSIALSILVHFANNAIAFVGMLFMDTEVMMDETIVEMYGGELNAALIIAASILIAWGSIYYLNKVLPHNFSMLEKNDSWETKEEVTI